MPVAVDSKFINPAYLPQRKTLTFPSVGSTGYILGWGHDNADLSINTNNRFLRRIQLKTYDSASPTCRRAHYFNTTDAPYSVNFHI